MVKGPGTHEKFYFGICLTCSTQARTQKFGKLARVHALQDMLFINQEK